jgi:hypothetical protein
MGLMSRARVLGYKTCRPPDGTPYIYLPHSRRRRARRVVPMGQFTSHQPSSGGNMPVSKWAATDIELSARCPALVEYLTETITDAGQPRVTSTLLISCEDGLWKLGLTDRAQKGGNFDYKLWRSGENLVDALKALDEALQSGRADWRKFPKWSPGGKR